MKSLDYVYSPNTRFSPCGKVMPGFGGTSESKNQTTTTNTDKRLVVDQGIGISSDSSTVTVNSLDAGIVSSSLDSVNRAVNAVTVADATNGQGFSELISLADKLFMGAGNLVGATQQSALSTMAAYQTDAAGKIDNKTITILGVAAAAALFLGKK